MELREAIEKECNLDYIPAYWKAEHIMSLIKEANYVKLADDQTLPFSNKGYYQETAAGRHFFTTEISVDPQDMLKAGWRKVEAGNLIKPLPETLSKGLPKAKA